MKEEPKIVSIGPIDLTNSVPAQEPNLDDLPVVSLRETVLFPGVTFPIDITRDSTAATINEASAKGIPIGVFCQIDPNDNNPTVSGLHKYGVVAVVVKVFELPDGSKVAVCVGQEKIVITGEGAGSTISGTLSVKAKPVKETNPRVTDKEFAVMVAQIRDITMNIIKQDQEQHRDMIFNLENVDSPTVMINIIATHSTFPVDDEIAMLRKARVKDRAVYLLTLLSQSEQIAELKAEIMRKTRRNLEDHQRNMILQHQFDALREELYGDENDAEELSAKAEELDMPEDVKKRFDKEVEKLRRLNPQSPDYSVQYSYLQTLTELPWGKKSNLNTDFSKAEEVLNADHYGLEKVKERILEQLAVMMNNPNGRSPIVCLVGAPGVGKTSLGQSIARALGRDYQRVSLGGLHDEAEIRGHRRTYLGAMPGRIIDAIRRAGSSNPVLLLDEIDKTGSDYKGDPSAALLEVLDPEQNVHFHDNYIDVDYDLSQVLFIATANTLQTIPQPLVDRMEIIDISGYLLEEKVEIARRHLIPRIALQNGFEADYFDFPPETITKIVESYTSESGVRQLEKMLAKVVRQIILRKMRGQDFSATVAPDGVQEYLGVERYTPERYEVTNIPGVAVGLAWTQAGGEILFIESGFTQGKGEKLTITGNLGDVMKESAVIAMQVVKARAAKYGVEPEWFDTRQLHIHVPEGAIPKDGPSAGITMCTSILSAMTGKPVRSRLAMTGEITLRGKVLPVGGIKEKILAAKRAGITDIVLCENNRKDISEIRPIYLEGLTFRYVTTIDDVFDIALEK
ncbi:MAG: endopeptidase La [Duncaniella sp.]|nr:endopeptidase La [Duncaniella sp.]